MLPRIRKDLNRQAEAEPWMIPAVLPGYPRPGVGLCVDLYQPQDPAEPWMVLGYSDPEAGR